MPTPKQVARFWSHVRRGPSCWTWTVSKDRDGYGRCSPKYGSDKAHRASFLLSGKCVPKGRRLNHKCNNRACVNPKHLEISTAKKDAAHRIASGRRLIGENNGQCKLTARGLRLLRSLREDGATGTAIAAAVGLGKSQVYRILSAQRRQEA